MSTTTERGLLLPCPKCGEPRATITLELSDMSSFTCRECEAEFSADEVRDVIARWRPVLVWLDTAPTPQAE